MNNTATMWHTHDHMQALQRQALWTFLQHVWKMALKWPGNLCPTLMSSWYRLSTSAERSLLPKIQRYVWSIMLILYWYSNIQPQGFYGATNDVLLSSSLSTSGTRSIPYTANEGSQIECEISGCTTEGWFSYSYAIPPIYHTCDMGLQELSKLL